MILQVSDTENAKKVLIENGIGIAGAGDLGIN